MEVFIILIVLSLRLIVLMLVFISLFHLFYYKLKIDVHFIPIISFSGVISILFFAGLLNIMYVVTFIINSLLLFYLIHILIRKRLNTQFVTVGFFFFVFMILFFAVIYRGTMLTWYDDFSHWGLMAREIINNDQLPNFETPVIHFPSYPPGSALFLYYISKIMGYSEGVLFFSQSILLVSGILPLFALVKNNKLFKYTIIVLSTVLLLTANNHIFMLTVDTMLSVLSIAVLVILSYLQNNNELDRAPILITPILWVLIILKNSGVFFVFISLFLFIYLSYSEKENKLLNRPKSLILLSPFILSFLWGKHVALVYTNALDTKHSFSVSNYRNVFGEKNPNEIRDILSMLTERMTNISNSDVQVFSGVLITFFVIYIYKRMNQAKPLTLNHELKLLLFSLLLYILYQASLGGMYIFSMPISEASRLAGYIRYNYTIVLYIYGVLLVYILRKDYYKQTWLSNLLKSYLILVVFSFILAPDNNNLSRFMGQSNEDKHLRSELLEAKGDQNIPPNKKVYIYYSDKKRVNDEDGYLRYVARYDFTTNNVSIIDASSIDSVIANQNDYYIIFVDQDNIYNDIFEKANVIEDRIIYIN